MRIISGSAKGRKLREIRGLDIRPTTDQVKEALFNIVQFDVEGRRTLDLFGGTGQLGLEAASRGARETVIVDASAAAVRLIRENARRCGLEVRVVCADALSFLNSCGRFDLIFLDAPYDSGLTKKALLLIKEIDILSEGGIIVCETRRDSVLPEPGLPYRFVRQYLYGRVKLSTFTRGLDNHVNCDLSG